MKVEVTHLKAAWPEGTRVGDVVDVEGDAIPAWAAGKCRQVEAPAKAEAPAPAAPAAKSKR